MIDERGSGLAVRIWEASERVVCSRLAYAEARAALAAARRLGRLSVDYQPAVRAFERLFLQINVIEVGEALVHRAGNLADEYDLRGYDAVHLASALGLIDMRPLFVTWDADLAVAASIAGIATAPAPA